MLAFVFRDCPPAHLVQLRLWGVEVASLSDCPNVPRVGDFRSFIKDKFVIVVGDRRLAERFGVAHSSVREVEQFLKWLMKESPPPVFKPYLN